jgi:hypothetical protein
MYSVFCDGDTLGCHGWIAETNDGAAAARRQAREAGWVRREGRDLCPSCKDAARP